MRRFKSNDEKYAAWLAVHPNSFVVIVDVPQTLDEYPMVHSASHAKLFSPEDDDAPPDNHEKVCSDDLAELEEWCKETYGVRLTFCRSLLCGQVLKKAALSDEDMDTLWS